MDGRDFKQIPNSALFVPKSYPDAIGIGCPKCGKGEIVPLTVAVGNHEQNADLQRFMKAHADCGEPLEHLEVRDGKLRRTGTLDPNPS